MRPDRTGPGATLLVRALRMSAMGLALVMLAGLIPAASAAAARDPRPNIVVIYMDDFSPLADWLWCDADRTKALARFCRDGLWFRNAIASTPLCCPARGNVLSGRYGHANGITQNDPRRFDPGRTIAVKLSNRGYVTGFAGKYLNALAAVTPTRQSVLKYAQGWKEFDVIWENQGRFFGYRQWRRSGTRRYGHKASDHSSFVAGARAARHITDAPRGRPVFEFVSLYDGHKPYQPMPRFKNHAKCRNVKPWSGPAFSEKDVSDKPAYVQKKPRLRRSAYGLQARCEEIMTVNFVVQTVRAALRKTGRLQNTLFVFTADNGWLMGDHRIVGKTHSYSTPVPMYMLWPAKLGDVGRVIEEPVSNVDYAKTFCALAGCSMPGSHGKNLMPLIKGKADHLDRKFIYEEMLHPGPVAGSRPGWYGLRTTLKFSDTRWVYTEYSSGFRELYDLTRDPHQLRNLAGKRPAIQAGLRRMLHRNVIRPHRVRFSKVRLN